MAERCLCTPRRGRRTRRMQPLHHAVFAVGFFLTMGAAIAALNITKPAVAGRERSDPAVVCPCPCNHSGDLWVQAEDGRLRGARMALGPCRSCSRLRRPWRAIERPLPGQPSTAAYGRSPRTEYQQLKPWSTVERTGSWPASLGSTLVASALLSHARRTPTRTCSTPNHSSMAWARRTFGAAPGGGRWRRCFGGAGRPGPREVSAHDELVLGVSPLAPALRSGQSQATATTVHRPKRSLGSRSGLDRW